MIMMPYNPKYYLDLMQQCGLVKAKDLYAFFMSADEDMKKKIQVVVDEVKRNTQITLRSIKMKDIERSLR